eukprot:15123825-Alexandrium_andersonii.AAC.1
MNVGRGSPVRYQLKHSLNGLGSALLFQGSPGNPGVIAPERLARVSVEADLVRDSPSPVRKLDLLERSLVEDLDVAIFALELRLPPDLVGSG